MSTQAANSKSRIVKPISETKPPGWLFKYFMNPIMKRVARSPRSKVGDVILLLTFTGRKSHKKFTTPVGYRRTGDSTLELYTDSPWYKNLLGGAPVTVAVKGQEHNGWATATDDKDLIVKGAAEHLRRHGLKAAREIGIMKLNFMPSEDELRVILRDRAKITVELDNPGR